MEGYNMATSKLKLKPKRIKKGIKKAVDIGKLITWGRPTEKMERTRSKKLFFVVLFIFLLRLIFSAFA
ncbi:hypothetical protein CUS10_14260 [Enterococcus faecium]|nr:hypothetical protein CUS10_14260 [Enterococcus faecium]